MVYSIWSVNLTFHLSKIEVNFISHLKMTSDEHLTLERMKCPSYTPKWSAPLALLLLNIKYTFSKSVKQYMLATSA